ncbi:hypothetical protein NC653_004351 [Populus alba x Populus x berolinensis]|uniref:Uncharacterized protein n=1 Tax=Populus alba x Populus x berolinensis TaxID=444605 RepID=A0AAD6RTT8_9ROSI|nr:hypothetical protein NC653_004351 [Populus alba x Populus x berolinensis]
METFKQPYHYQKGNFDRQRSNHTSANFVTLYTTTTKIIISSPSTNPFSFIFSLSTHKTKPFSPLQIPYLPIPFSH